MNPKKKLAIIIPAFKTEFFKLSLESIANQTCKNFTVYIGDDASPSNLKSIVLPYEDEIDIVYKRFEENLGGKDLVAHWDRCIEMSRDEEWIWLFSDDDIMEASCVELFYQHIGTHKENTLLHFNIQVINAKNEQLFKTKKFDKHYSPAEYFAKVMYQQVYSCVVEYIFKRELFEQVGGFQHFDLAWSSDTATWMKLAQYGGITTIDGAIVKWRMSNSNISSMSGDSSIVLRKTNAGVAFLNWAKVFFYEGQQNDLTSSVEKFNWLMIGIVYTSTLNYSQKLKLIRASLSNMNEQNLMVRILPFWLIEEMKRTVKSWIQQLQ